MKAYLLFPDQDFDFGPTSNSLNVYVGYLRKKTEAGGEGRVIHTVRGIGYRFLP